MIIEIASKVNVKWWDDLVMRSDSGCMFDTARWAECLKKALYIQPYYFMLKDCGELKALAVIEGRAIAHNRFYEKPFDKVALSILTKHAATFRMRGWIFLDNQFRESVDGKELAIKTDDALNSLGPMNVEIHRNPITGVIPTYEQALEERGFNKKEWATLLVGVNDSMDVITKRFRNSARKAIRKSEEQGITVERIMNINDLKRYHSFFRKAKKEFLKTWSPSFKFMRTMWEYLRGEGSHFEMFVAKENNEIVGGLGVWEFNGIISEFGAIRSVYAFKKGLYPGDILKYRIIEWAQSKGFRYYDLMGVSPNPKHAKDISIRQFKEKWGGELKTSNIFSKSYSKGLGRHVYSVIENLKKYRNKKNDVSVPR